MKKDDYIKILQTDEKELKQYMDRSKWHIMKMNEYEDENRVLKAKLKHLKVHGELIVAMLEGVELDDYQI